MTPTQASIGTAADTTADRDDAAIAAAPDPDAPAFAYRPELDGVRALAVVLVLAFHAGFGWMRGGYVGVSIFFTLSGFLITSVTVGEVRRTGTMRPLAFVARRVRRLMPASLLCLALIAVARSFGEYASAPGFGHELRAALFSFFNWTRAFGDRSYVDALAATGTHQSPMEHFWSLAVEEQYYLVWPFAVGAIVLFAARTRRRFERSLTIALVTVTALAIVAAPILATVGGPHVGYWATPVRAVEILVGACLAVLFAGRRPGRAAPVIAAVALAVLVGCAVWLPASSGPAYQGWMAPIAVASALLIRGLTPRSVLGTVFAARPAVALGRISYGVYLFHWPLFVALRQHGWDLTSVPAFLAACAITVAIAAASSRLVERPVRQWRADPPLVVAAGVAALLAASAAVPLVGAGRGFLEPDRAALAEASAANRPTNGAALVALHPAATTVTTAATTTTAVPSITTTTAAAVASGSTTLPAPPSTTMAPTPPAFVTDLAVPPAPNRPVRVVTIGDSTAFYVGQALSQWAVAHPDHMTSDLLWCQGCGFILDGTIVGWDAASFVERSNEIVHDVLPEKIPKLRPDVAVLMITIDDVADRQWSPDEGPLSPDDPRFVARMTAAYTAITDQLLDLGVGQVVWVRPPTPHWHGDPPGMADPSRWAAMDGVIDAVAAAAGPRVAVVDVDGWSRAAGHADDPDWRPDGVHLTEATASELVDRWLAPWLLDHALGTQPD